MLTQLTVENFEDIVLGADHLVLVDFYADWCGPCQAAAPILEELSDEYDGRVTIAKVDVDAQPELSKRYDVMSIPTLIVFKDGEEVERKVGFGGREGYEELIRRFLPV